MPLTAYAEAIHLLEIVTPSTAMYWGGSGVQNSYKISTRESTSDYPGYMVYALDSRVGSNER